MPNGAYEDGRFVSMFYYVGNPQIAREIMNSRQLVPEDGDRRLSELDPRFLGPFVTLTDVRPEEGRAAIAAATDLPVSAVTHCLEVLIDRDRLVQALPFMPHTYQVFSGDPVPVRVIRDHDVGRIERRQQRGLGIERALNHGFPYAQLVATEPAMAQATR
jgi:hypothetical protein